MPILMFCLASCAGSSSVAQEREPPAAGRSTALSTAHCHARLDAAVTLAESGDVGRARLHLERLAPRCEHVPQIHHDLGVIAARAGRQAAALEHFTAAIEAEPRAAMTLEHLRALHRREAARGYARALGRPDTGKRPDFAFQRSSDGGADTRRDATTEDQSLRDVAALELELFGWWRSAVNGSARERLEHYVDDYPRTAALAGREHDAKLRWETVRREIVLTTRDAVAILEYSSVSADTTGVPVSGSVPATEPVARAGTSRRLLLLRLQDDRWRIYRDMPL